MTCGKLANDFEDLGDGTAAKGGLRVGTRFYAPNPFLMRPKINAAAADVRAAGASLQAAKWQIESKVRLLYAEIHYLDDDMGLTQELAHQYELILQDERAREGEGAATAPEIVSAVHHELQAQSDLDQARYRWQAAERELAGMLDMDLGSAPLRLTTNAPGFAPTQDGTLNATRMQQIAAEHRNDLAALHWRTLAARHAYVEARNVRVPWLKDVEFTRRDSDAEWWLGIGINVPLFSWTINNVDGVQQAEFKLAQANESNGLQMMRREVRDAVDELEMQRQQQERNRQQLAPLLAEMQQTLDLLKRTTNVMPSQIAATEAQITESARLKLESDWLYQRAWLDLERTVGMPVSAALEAE
jgi:outer membrane protein TolC